jgi:hypothetical protein
LSDFPTVIFVFVGSFFINLPPTSHNGVQKHCPWSRFAPRVIILFIFTTYCNSTVEFYCRRINVAQAKDLSRMEEAYQMDLWGLVEGGHDMDILNNSVNLSSLTAFWHLYHNTSSETKCQALQNIDNLVVGLRSQSMS